MPKSLSSVLLLATLLPACLDGDRALSGGKCPAGETCSDQAPKGLEFLGANRSSQLLDLAAIPPTAVGGVQTVTLLDARTGNALSADWRGEATGPVAVSGQRANTVTVTGTGDGEAMLRIVDADDGSLLDRHSLRAATIARIDLLSTGELHAVPSAVWIQGADIEAALAYRDASGEPVVDERATVALATSGTGTLELLGWDRIAVRGAPVGAVVLAVNAGGLRAHRVEATIVDGIDTIVDGGVPPADVAAGAASAYCFEGRRDGAAVNGLTWTFAFEGMPVSAASSLRGCTTFTPSQAGTVTIIATSAGLSARRAVAVAAARPAVRSAPVDGADNRGPASVSDDSVTDDSRGDRARLD